MGPSQQEPSCGTEWCTGACVCRTLLAVPLVTLPAQPVALRAHVRAATCRNVSLEQTIKHWHGKHGELASFKDGIKLLSPASETSCLEAVPPHLSPLPGASAAPPILPRSAAPHSAPSQAGVRAQELFILACDLDNAVCRLHSSVISINTITSTAPRLRVRLAEFMATVDKAPQGEAVCGRARAFGWAIAACSAEFGCDVRSNAAALSHACESFLALAKPDKQR